MLSKPGWGRARFIVCLAAATVLCPLLVGATPPLQKKAQALGHAASDCSYCHTFDMEHMRRKAHETGVREMNCGVCHGKKLPKTGRELLNGRGNWLLDEKIRRDAKAVDPAWLREYAVK